MDGTWNSGNLRFGKCPGPIFQIPTNKLFLKMPALCPGPIFQISASKNGFEKSQIREQLSDFKSPLSATLIIFWHKWEDGSRKVNMNAVSFSPTPWNFWPVMSQAVRKPCFSTSIPRGQNPIFPPPPPLDELSNPDPGPSQCTQGWNTSARVTLAVDVGICRSQDLTE